MTIDWYYNLKMILDFYAHHYTQITFKLMGQCSYLLLLLLKKIYKIKQDKTEQFGVEVKS